MEEALHVSVCLLCLCLCVAGKARQGKARQGKARQGKRLFLHPPTHASTYKTRPTTTTTTQMAAAAASSSSSSSINHDQLPPPPPPKWLLRRLPPLQVPAAQLGKEQGGGALALRRVLSPMPGRVVKVLVSAGDSVRKGQPLVILEAMKMEHVCMYGGHRIMSRHGVVTGWLYTYIHVCVRA